MNRIEATPMKADLTLGLNKLYSNDKNSLQDLIKALSKAQLKLNTVHGIKMSTKVTPCKIIFSGQDEDSVTISFINYPRFPIEPGDFKKGVEFIAKILMEELIQNRIVIEYADTTVMLEKSEEIDPKISL